MEKTSRTQRERYPMPDFIRDALAENKLTAAYDARPPYQRNDYIGWITRAFWLRAISRPSGAR